MTGPAEPADHPADPPATTAPDQPSGDPDPAPDSPERPAEPGESPAAESTEVTENADENADAGDAGAAGNGEAWSRFAPEESGPVGPVRRALGAAGRFAGHEWTLASLFGLLLAVVMTWPTMLHPASTIPQDIYDPLLQAWQVAWGGHALLTDPLHIFDSNTFFPAHNTLAYSDSLLGYAPLGMIGSGPVAALVRYNVLYVLAYALAFVGMYALCRQLGSRWPGAVAAAAAVAYAPWRLAHGGHLNILSTGGIPLALAMLARGHGFSLRRRPSVDGEPAPGGYRPSDTRWGWALGGWLVAAWQVTLGWGLGLPFAYVLGVIVLVSVVGWFVHGRRRVREHRSEERARSGAVPEPASETGRPRFPRRLLLGDLAGLVVFGLTCVAMGLPYLSAVHDNPNARRSVADLAMFSPPWEGFLTAPEQSWLWGDLHAGARAALPFQPEMTLLVGVVLLGFALIGLVLSVWRTRTRLLLALGVAVSVALAMGTRFPGGGKYTYLVLFHYLPAWESIRTPGRLVFWTTLLLGLLAAGAIGILLDRAGEVALDRGRNPRRLGGPMRLALLIPLLLVLIEGWNRTPHPAVPAEPAGLRQVAGPVLILPTDTLSDQGYMYWSTGGFPRLVNGGSGFEPKGLTATRQVATAFPDPTSVAYLRSMGVRTVVVLRDRLDGTPYQNAASAPVDELNLTRRDAGPLIIFTLR